MLAEKNPQIAKAVGRLQELTEDERERLLAESREKWEWDMQAIREHGIKKGREEGLEKGLEKGREEGLQKGREEGRKEGLEKGLEKGREEGIEKGLEKGREEGIEQGIEKGLLSVATAALKKNLPIEDIMALTGLSREKILSLPH